MHPPVRVIGANKEEKAHPIGIVANMTPGFVLPGQGPAQIIVASEDGTISGWSGGAETIVMASNDASYTGLAVQSNPRGEIWLYAADFKGGKIDVYDGNFALMSGMAFNHPPLPEGFAPFNVTVIGRFVYVAYALRGPDGDEVTGPGLGYVDVFTPRGFFVRRLAPGPDLNAPWGIAGVQSTESPYAGVLYVANFGDGTISRYNMEGNFIGQLHDGEGNIIKIDGIWGMMFANQPGIDPNRMYFASGPNDEMNGTFGYIRITSSQ